MLCATCRRPLVLVHGVETCVNPGCPARGIGQVPCCEGDRADGVAGDAAALSGALARPIAAPHSARMLPAMTAPRRLRGRKERPMAALVDEVMNRELFSVGPDEPAELVLRWLLVLDVTGAPVLDDAGKPIGMISLRDLLGRRAGTTVGDRMSRPVVTVPEKATLEDAGKILGEAGFHHLVVVDASGGAVGIVSSLDVTRGLVGLPAMHPPSFPHYDRTTGVIWTDDRPLEFERVETAPDAPGVFVLVHGARGLPERIVWAESAPSVRDRLIEMLSDPTRVPPHLRELASKRELRFRAAKVSDAADRERALRGILERMASSLPSSAPHTPGVPGPT